MGRKYLVLFFILGIGVFLRFYKLGDIPAGFHRDEAFLGYNAYSILRTGKDIQGIFLPVHLKSFLYSPAGYAYFSIPFILVFGLSEFSTRFASAFFNSLTILAIFFLVGKLFEKYKYKNVLALLSSFFFAISPWNINLARTATENTIVVFFIILGMLFFLEWNRNSKLRFLIFSFLSFAITFLLYQASRAFLPIFIPAVFFIIRDKKSVFTRKTIMFFLLFLLTMLLPLLIILQSKDLSLRIRTVSIFSTSQTQLMLDEQIRNDGVVRVSPSITRVFHNKLIGYASLVVQNYFKHFSYDFLFTDQGFPDRYRVPLAGLLYLYDLPFIILGVYLVIKRKERGGLILFVWVLLAPLGSALTFDDIPNLQRTLLLFPAFSILSALGFLETFIYIRNRKLSILLVPFCIMMIYQITFYFHQYYYHYNRYRPWYRNDGYKELVKQVNSISPHYKKVVITNRESAPTIFFLFYNKYDPILFQAETKNSILQDFDRVSFGKYEFTQEECPVREISDKHINVIPLEKNILFVNSGLCKIPQGITIKSVIKRADGTTAFYVLAK